MHCLHKCQLVDKREKRDKRSEKFILIRNCIPRMGEFVLAYKRLVFLAVYQKPSSLYDQELKHVKHFVFFGKTLRNSDFFAKCIQFKTSEATY